MSLRACCTILAFAMLPTPVLAAAGHHHHAPSPVGVMGTHLHQPGEWMAGYHNRRSSAEGIRDGRNSADIPALLDIYGEAPVKMDMQMHMVEIMRGMTPDLTLMIMPHFMEMGMTHLSIHGAGHAHAHEMTGWGDTEVTGLYSIYRAQNQHLQHNAHLHFGVSLPTGSIDKTFRNHHNNAFPLPYNMQFGSGTFDPILGATYTGASPDWSWGAQTLNVIRAGKNENGWRQGNKYSATGWVARKLAPCASLSLRLEGEAMGNVSGRDVRLPLTTIAGANPDEQSLERLLLHVGLNLLEGEDHGPLAGHRLGAELGMPLYEHTSGPQPKTDYRLTLAWQFAF